MKRILFFLIFFQAVAFGFAQNKPRDLKIYTVETSSLKKAADEHGAKTHYNYVEFRKAIENKLVPVTATQVFSFVNNSQRESFVNKYMDKLSMEGKTYYLLKDGVDFDKTHYVAQAETDANGEVEIDAPDGGVFIVAYEDLQGFNDSNNRWLFFDYGESGKGIENNTDLEIFLPSNQSKEMDFTQKVKTERRGGGVSTPFHILWKWTYPIEAENANPDIRLGFRPIAKEYESGGVFKLIDPKVVDGANFRVYQRQRMGQDIQKNDPMGAWADSMLIYAGKPDTVKMSDRIGKKVPGKHYTVDMEIYQMSHDGIYSCEKMQVYDGRERMPLKYIDFKLSSTKINKSLFIKQGQKEESSVVQNTRLPFEVGKATLNPADELGQRELAKAVKFARDKAYAREISGQRFVIEGFASPEGNEQSNERLAYSRAIYLRDQISRQVPNQQIIVKQPAIVQPWTIVADSIERLGPDYKSEAQQVRAICEQTAGLKAQEARIKALPFYKELINDSILPMLRISRIEAFYTIREVLSPDTVIARYQRNPAPYLNAERYDYEYYHLMEFYQDDLEKLEPIAQVAHDMPIDEANRIISRNVKWADRPWTLPSYHLARCKVNHGEFEEAENILREYVYDSLRTADWNLNTKVVNIPSGGFSRAPVNEPAVCLLYLDALCGSGKYQEAYEVFLNSLDNDKYKVVGQFILTMSDPEKLFTDAILRNSMAATSKWNSMIVNAAFCGEEDYPSQRKICVDNALKILQSDTTIFKDDDPRVHYIKARLLFDKLCQAEKAKNRLPRCNEADAFTLDFAPAKMRLRNSMAAELMKAFMLDENFLYDELRWDGYFPMGVYLKAKEVWEKNDPTKFKLHASDAEFVKKYAKPHKPKTEAPKEN